MGIKIGICGTGNFASNFIGLYNAHPLVEEVVLADLQVDRAQEAARPHGIKRVMGSLDELCASDVDGIAIFTQRHLHAPQAIQALKAGKHVLCAVPAGLNLEEIAALVETVQRTGLTYMMNETSFYCPAAIFARRQFVEGGFGRFVFGEAQYMHDMGHMYASFKHSGGANWKRHAGIPPMYYATHSVSLVLCVTGARATHVACTGFIDNHPDGIYLPGVNAWENRFSNESALMRTSDGATMRINEFRRIGWDSHNMCTTNLYGTGGCFEEHPKSVCWTKLEPPTQTDISAELKIGAPEGPTGFQGVSSVHPVERLPLEFRGRKNGHQGSHYFLVDDFVRAVHTGQHPPCDVWNAANWTAPGIVAHASACREGEWMPIPDFGVRPG